MAEKRQKNTKVEVKFIDGAGEEHSRIPKGVAGVRVSVPAAGYTEKLMFAEMPEDILVQGAAFGIGTVLRNCVNTASDELEGAQTLQGRVDGWKKGEWASTGEGGIGGTPLIIQAIQATLEGAGKDPEEVKENIAEKLEKWAEMSPKQRKDQQAEWLKVGPVKVHYYRIKEEQLRAQLARVQGAADGDTAEGDIESL